MIRSGRSHFMISFAISCIALYGAIFALPEPLIRPVNEHVARTLGATLNTLGVAASTSGDVVSADGLAFRIVIECTPVFMAGLFICFVMFYPAGLYGKVVGLSVGIPALYLGNLLRLMATFMVSLYDRRLFEVSHVYLGQVFTMLFVILSAIVWLKWLDAKESRQGPRLKTVYFLMRFALVSGCLFLVWMKVHHLYIRLLDFFMLLGFSLFGRHFLLARDTAVYFETFSVVLIISLAAAMGSVPWRRRIPPLCAGLSLLSLIHLFHRIDNALIALYNQTALLSADLALLVAGQYLVPVFFLIYMAKFQRREAADCSFVS